MGMNLVDLPLEILLEVVHYIDTLHDIISLSLTTHALYDVLVPTHTEYFEIRCTVNKVNFWKHLQEHPRLCKRIRRLILVQHQKRTRLPKPFDMSGVPTSAATSSEGFKLLCSLLPQMNNLNTFRSTALDTVQDASRFLAALTQSKCVLEELRFGYPRYAWNFSSNNWDFDWSRLSHLSFFLDSTIIAEGVLSKVLTGCPRLTELCFIVAPGLVLSNILVQGRWPNLKRLGLEELVVWNTSVYHPTEDLQQRPAILRSFFSRHPLLEVVHIPAEIYPSGFLMELENLLPSIKSLSFPNIESVPPLLASRLEHIYAGQWDAQWDISFFSYLPNLQSCIINVQRLSNNANVRDLTEYIPNVERLCFWSGGFRTTLDEIQKSAQICFRLKKLTTLFLSDFYFLDLTQEPDQFLINKISQAIPSLKYINAYQNGHASLIRLTKDPVTGTYRGFQYVSPMPTVANIAEQWGNFLFYNSNAE